MLMAKQANKLQAAIDHLVPAVIRQDLHCVHTFLDTYRHLATTQEVLDLLFAR